MKLVDNRHRFLFVWTVLLGGCASLKNDAKISADPAHLWQPTHASQTTVSSTLTSIDETLGPSAEGTGTGIDAAIPKQPYSLPDRIALGLSRNLQTRVAWWQAKRALAQSERAKTPYYPTLTATLGANRTQTGAVFMQPSSQIDTFGPGLSVTYRLFQFGADKAQAESAACTLASANYAFNHQLQTAVYSIQLNYYRYASAVAKIEAQQSNVEDAAAAFHAIEGRRKNGLASVQDFLSAEANKLQAEYDLKVAQSELERYRADLALSVGVPISNDFQVDVVFNDASILVEEVETLMEKALQSRSDLLSKEEALHAADWAHLKTEREQWPSVNVTGTVNTLKYRHYPHWQNNYTVGINLSWDIFSGFEKQYKELEQYAAMKEKRFELHQLQLKILGDVWSEFHAFQAVKKSFSVAQALETASRKSYEAIQMGYESGLNNVLELLDAQSKLAQARLQRIRSQSDLCIHWAQLAYVAGQMMPPPSTPNEDSSF